MSRLPRIISRRKLETLGTSALILVAAGAVVSRGPLLERRGPSPVADVLARPVAPTILGELADRASGPAWDLPNIDNEAVDQWVARLTGPMKPSLGTYFRRMQRYEEMIASKADERGLPRDLVYLAMIESGGNPTALSPVKARGLWQFMSGTARGYGLTVSGARDDRIDPERSTDAALRYLGDLYARFGSWYLAAAAYNGGQGRVGRILKEETGRDRGTDEDFYRIAHRLPRETRDYVPKMIAVARVAKEPERFGFTPEYIASRPLVEKPVARKPAPRKPATRAAARPAAKTAARPATRAAAKPPAKPAASRVAAKPAAKPASRAAAKPAAKPATRAAAKPAAKPATRTAARPAAKTAARPAAKTAARPSAAKKPAPRQPARTATPAKRPAAAKRSG